MTHVYGAYSQAELDAQYDQSSRVPDMDRYVSRWEEMSAAWRAACPPRVLRYGPHERQTVDVFVPSSLQEGVASPLHVHLHGGAWRSMCARAVSHLGRPLLASGIGYAAIGFPLAPEASLDAMVASVVAGLDAIQASARDLGVDAAAVSLSGFSSGAHLAAMLLARRPEAGLIGATLVSGVHDLEPVRLSARNCYLALDEDAARRASPVLQPWPPQGAPIALFAGGEELDEFRRQSEAFADALRRQGRCVSHQEMAGLNHFDMFDALCDPDSAVFASVLAHHLAG